MDWRTKGVSSMITGSFSMVQYRAKQEEQCLTEANSIVARWVKDTMNSGKGELFPGLWWSISNIVVQKVFPFPRPGSSDCLCTCVQVDIFIKVAFKWGLLTFGMFSVMSTDSINYEKHKPHQTYTRSCAKQRELRETCSRPLLSCRVLSNQKAVRGSAAHLPSRAPISASCRVPSELAAILSGYKKTPQSHKVPA